MSFSNPKTVHERTRHRKMLIVESKTFYDAIKPLVYFNYFAGASTYRLPNQSSFTYIMIKLYAVIITIICWITIYIELGRIIQMTEYENMEPMTFTMHKALICTTSGFGVIAPLLILLRRKELRNYLRRILVLDNTFQTVFGVPNEYEKHYTRLSRQVIGILLVMILFSMIGTLQSYELFLSMNFREQFMIWTAAYATYHPILIMLLLDLNFCTFVGYLGQKFRDVNDSLLGFKEKPFISYRGNRLSVISQNVIRNTLGNEVKDTETEDVMKDKHYLLQDIRKVHLELCKLSRIINRAFGIQNLISVGMSVVMIVGSLYTIYSAFSWANFTNKKLAEVFEMASWTAICVFKIWMVNHSCQSVNNEAGRTGEVIYELLDSRIYCSGVEEKIQEFGVQMLQNSIRFNACGFFNLDHTFIQGVIGTVTTYLVILIQMSPGPEISTSDIARASNDTKVSAN